MRTVLPGVDEGREFSFVSGTFRLILLEKKFITLCVPAVLSDQLFCLNDPEVDGVTISERLQKHRHVLGGKSKVRWDGEKNRTDVKSASHSRKRPFSSIHPAQKRTVIDHLVVSTNTP